ncbi:MAG: 50S ribosomal protein L19 [Verrucomicrobia bacterium]|nr:50S ribosomal protein L19 [Verrucomicrobiota bacterium]
MTTLVQEIEKAHKKAKTGSFAVGDTVKVHTKIIEGDKERIQIFQGIIIARKGEGLSENFTVSRVAFGYANEKVFPLHSPTITKIEVIQKGDVRKAKLNYIRGKLGKAAKISAKIGGIEEALAEEARQAAEEAT